MQSTREFKKEFALNTELTELLDVLKSIAASEFRVLERKKERFAKFIETFNGFFRMINFSAVEHPFAQDKLSRLGIIMITSDEGFMGGLNARVINAALGYSGSQNAELVIIGRRGAAYLKGLGKKFTAFPGIISEERYEAALKLRDFIVKETMAGRFSKLILIYPKPVSFTLQHIEVLNILPCGDLFKKRERLEEEAKEGAREPIVESSLSGIIEYLVKIWIAYKLLEVFEDSKLSEFSARTVHLEQSYQDLIRQGKVLRFQYFRSHHEFVDKGMRETFSAQLIRKGKQ